ncbi:hypothetical protein [Streptomyces sp. NBC_01264]|uniref:hypothetical protein n=1 Tax=Streptomyces sp. NBC_01264 TaxID=2903804 RepID=UPI002255F2AA|nr:hypothetical protein [Streptomyces sp. NBC_01264]MCX4780124.1 hypothetical protein [Streptomyces sp. NBC_01264]
MSSMVLVRLDEGRGSLAYIPRPIPLDSLGHSWEFVDCFLCGAVAGSPEAGRRCPEADEVEFENAELAAYAHRYAVPGQPSV